MHDDPIVRINVVDKQELEDFKDAHPEAEVHDAKFSISSDIGEDGTPTMTVDDSDLDADLGEGATQRLQDILDDLIAQGDWLNYEPPELVTKAVRQLFEERIPLLRHDLPRL